MNLLTSLSLSHQARNLPLSISFSNSVFPWSHSSIQSLTRQADFKPTVLSPPLLRPVACTSNGLLVVTTDKAKELSQEKQFDILVDTVRRMLESLGDGNISLSPYDTAWVARIPSVYSVSQPEFPQALDWIIRNQYPDGSWGDIHFNLQDRVLNTLSCLVALKQWNIGHDSIKQGLQFLSTNMKGLKDVSGDLLSGFEVTFPSMLEEARQQRLDIPYNIPFIKKIQESRKVKLERIPIEMVYSVPTTLLYSLEGLQEYIDWNKIMQVQQVDGSFLSSPSSTACVYLHTKNESCLRFIRKAMKAYDNAVPCHYPIDVFERLWVVDTIERLGIDSFFKAEIKKILDYIYKCWTEKGIGWGKDSNVRDIDDTAMAFRLLRTHGYHVSSDVFYNFVSNGKFFCFLGETSHGISEMLNLFRATQVAFPNDSILMKAREYSRNFLCQALNGTYKDKWAIKKDLLGEVKYELENPWYTSLPKRYMKSYIKKYGENDLWIAKTLYRLYCVNNKALKDIAKKNLEGYDRYQDFELKQLTSWWRDCGFENLQSTRSSDNKDMIPYIYFVISSTMFEEKFHNLRLFFTKYATLNTVIDDLIDNSTNLQEISSFVTAVKRGDASSLTSKDLVVAFNALQMTLDDMATKAAQFHPATSKDILSHLQEEFLSLIQSELVDTQWKLDNYKPGFQEYMQNAKISSGAANLILGCMLFCGEEVSKSTINKVRTSRSLELNCIISKLVNDLQTFKIERQNGEMLSSISCYIRDHPTVSENKAIESIKSILEESWKELVQEYLKEDNDLPPLIRRYNFELVRMTWFTYKDKDIFRMSNKDPEKVALLQNLW